MRGDTVSRIRSGRQARHYYGTPRNAITAPRVTPSRAAPGLTPVPSTGAISAVHTMNTNACLYNACRRLRWLRRNPPGLFGKTPTPAERDAMARAYEYALSVLIDEFGARDHWHTLFYGADETHKHDSYSKPVPVTLPGETTFSAMARIGGAVLGPKLPSLEA